MMHGPINIKLITVNKYFRLHFEKTLDLFSYFAILHKVQLLWIIYRTRSITIIIIIIIVIITGSYGRVGSTPAFYSEFLGSKVGKETNKSQGAKAGTVSKVMIAYCHILGTSLLTNHPHSPTYRNNLRY